MARIKYLLLILYGSFFNLCKPQLLNDTETTFSFISNTSASTTLAIRTITKSTTRPFTRTTSPKNQITISKIYYTATSTLIPTLPIIEVQNTTKIYYTVLRPDTPQWIQYSDVGISNIIDILDNRDLTVKMIDLRNKFIFYGHQISRIGITTSGFLFTNEFLHKDLTFSNYIAPLMAYFHTYENPFSKIKYFLNDTILIVWYDSIELMEIKDKMFTFQVILYQTGDIIFNYKQIPMKYEDIPNKWHKVTVGVSDAYAVDADNPLYIIIRKYNTLMIQSSYIVSNSSLILKIVETCLAQKTCTECFKAKMRIPFDCQWCPVLSRCSDGQDRLRQEWLHYSCPTDRTTNIANCIITKKGISKNYLWLLLLLFFVPLIVFFGWVIYSIKFPTTPSGQFLIRNHPSKWCERVREGFRNIKSKQEPASYVSFDQPHSTA